MPHARYSPSQLPRILDCPGSVEYNLVRTSSVYAEEGSMLHACVEECLDLSEFTISKETCDKFKLTSEQKEAVQACLDYASGLNMAYGDEDSYFVTETHVTLEGLAKPMKCEELSEVSGTLDLGFVFPSIKSLYVIDWKFGAGVEVDIDTDQLKAYAVGFIKKLNKPGFFEKITLVIVQPRLYSGDKVKELELTPDDLINWMKTRVVPNLQKVNWPNPPMNPSDKACRWCAIRTSCPARHQLAQEQAKEVFALHAELPNVDPEKMEAFLGIAADLRQYISDLELWAYNRISSGEEVKGFKLVAGRSTRQWADAKEAESYLLEALDDPYTKKLMSPTQAEKALGPVARKEEDFLKLIIKPEGKPTLVSDADRRPALSFKTASEKFADYAVSE